MKITIEALRALIKEELLREAQMHDPIAIAVGNALVAHMRDPAFVDAVAGQVKGQGNSDNAEDELVVTLPGSQLFRQAIAQVVKAVASKATAKQPQQGQPAAPSPATKQPAAPAV